MFILLIDVNIQIKNHICKNTFNCTTVRKVTKDKYPRLKLKFNSIEMDTTKVMIGVSCEFFAIFFSDCQSFA